MPAKAENMDENQPSEFDKFFSDLPTEDKRVADIFGEGNGEQQQRSGNEQQGQQQASGNEEGEPRKNRRHRRLEAQLTQEKEARIAAEARAKALAEIGPRAQAEDVDERLMRMYGPEHIDAAKLHMDLLRDYENRAKEAAIREIEARNTQRAEEVRQFEQTIAGELESIEDEYGVDLTSDAPTARKARTEFIGLIEKLSPKDEAGKIAAYADFQETWELYQLKNKQGAPTARAKEVAARSMEQGGSGQPTPQQPTPGFRGWMRDFHINP